MNDATRAALLALAERCEKASGPDDVLDADIFQAMRPELASDPWKRVTYPNGKHPFFVDDSDLGMMDIASPPRFTASIDAARTLVPEGWQWWVNWRTARCWKGWRAGDDRDAADNDAWVAVNSCSAPPAAALCAAALRARAEEARHD